MTMGLVRTPEARFRDLPDYPFTAHWLEMDGMRMHYVDEGRGAPVLLLHGEPTWLFLYRVEGAGHFLQEEAGDRIGPAIAGFLDRGREGT